MAKLVRKSQKVFGSTAGTNERGVIGSFAAGSPAYSTDPDTIQSLSNFLQGWYGVVVGQNSPAIQDMNALDFLLTRQLAYLFQSGVAEYDSGTTYYIGSLASDGFGGTYVSITDDNTGNALSDTSNWRPFSGSSRQAENLSIAASVGSNALTVALKNKIGSDPSAASPVSISFRNSTLTTGTYNTRQVTGALSMVVSNGSFLGQLNGIAGPIFVYALDNAGTVELAVSSTLFNTDGVISTTAEGGAGAADSRSVMYSTTARTNVPFRLIGKLISTQPTAGVWTVAPTVTTTQLDVPARAVWGDTTGSAALSGAIGEIYQTSFTGGGLASTVAGRAAIITLPSPGKWVCFVTIAFTGTATSCTVKSANVSTADAYNIAFSADNAWIANNLTYNVATSLDESAAMPPLIVSSSGAPQIYVWTKATFGGGTMNAYGYATCYRIG